MESLQPCHEGHYEGHSGNTGKSYDSGRGVEKSINSLPLVVSPTVQQWNETVPITTGILEGLNSISRSVCFHALSRFRSSLSFGFNSQTMSCTRPVVFVDVRLRSLNFHKGTNRSYSTYAFVMFKICITICVITNNGNTALRIFVKFI